MILLGKVFTKLPKRGAFGLKILQTSNWDCKRPHGLILDRWRGER
jgi:hypothetical protein